ncbi:MAG: flavoprotein [Gammaproteobacteria bacterium]|nr:flavoprotein [Gammaproteobacteria bacterium]
MDTSSLFLFVTGAGSCVGVPDLIGGLVARGYAVYSVLTPNVSLVVAPDELMEVPGNRWIREYGQPPLERYPFGTLIVAPCSFNTLNKISLGLSDNLATSMIADGIGAGNPVIVAPAMNLGQWSHPRTKESLERLESWGCVIVPPHIVGQRVSVPNEDILKCVVTVAC